MADVIKNAFYLDGKGRYLYSADDGGYCEVLVSRIPLEDMPDLVLWLQLVTRQYERKITAGREDAERDPQQETGADEVDRMRDEWEDTPEITPEPETPFDIPQEKA